MHRQVDTKRAGIGEGGMASAWLQGSKIIINIALS